MALLDRFRKEPPPSPEKSPKSTPGRGHTAGFVHLEEHNPDLQHPNGQTIWDRMWRTDADIRQVGSLVINPIVGGTWAMQPHGGQEATPEDQNVADFAWSALMDQMEPNLLGHLIEFLPVLIRGGFTPGEITWMGVDWKGERKIVPRRIYLRLPRTIMQWEQDEYEDLTRIKQYPETPKSAVTRREDGTGATDVADDPGEIWLDMKDLVYYRLGAEGDNWEGVSLLRPAHKHWVYKDTIEKLAAIGMEREALGVPICYPPTGATEEQLDAMEDILASMRTNEEGFIIAPGPKAGPGFAPEGQGWLIEVIGYDRTGSGRDPQPLLEYHSAKIAAAFIAEFMRLGHGETGARATAQVQADPFLASIEALTTIIESVLQRLVNMIVAYNFPGVENPPKLKMSLVDSTSLQQLADFVQKLTQIGALLPDQELEDFLRARADLPAANPESVKKRGAKDDQIRRDIVQPPKPDAFGANDKPGKEHGTKASPGANKPGASGGRDRGSKEKKLMTLDDGTAILAEPMSDRWRHREQRWFEMLVDLDSIEDAMDDQPDAFARNTHHNIVKTARGMVAGAGAGDASDLRHTIREGLAHAYSLGQGHVVREIYAQRLPVEDESVMAFSSRIGADAIILDRGARDRGGDLDRRAEIAADQVVTAMRHAHQGADLSHGHAGMAQGAAEKAGVAAMRRVGHHHGVAALLHGRHDMGHQLAEAENGIDIIGARYSAILDRGTCTHCLDADDGVLRPLDDPIRLDRMPPNHHCESTRSGFNQCRCFEVFEVLPPNADPVLDSTSPELPEFIRDVALELMDRGMEGGRALSTAKNIARTFCRTGRLDWPGLSHLDVTRAMACDATGWQP